MLRIFARLNKAALSLSLCLFSTATDACLQKGAGTTYSQDTVFFSLKRKDDFLSRLDIHQAVIDLASSTKDGCTRGLMRKLAQNYKSSQQLQSDIINNIMKDLIGPRRSSPYITSLYSTNVMIMNDTKTDQPSNYSFTQDAHVITLPDALWMWAEKKCKNNKLRLLAQIMCKDATKTAQEIHDFALTDHRNWLLEKRFKKS